jgi:hypothetical protein
MAAVHDGNILSFLGFTIASSGDLTPFIEENPLKCVVSPHHQFWLRTLFAITSLKGCLLPKDNRRGRTARSTDRSRKNTWLSRTRQRLGLRQSSAAFSFYIQSASDPNRTP